MTPEMLLRGLAKLVAAIVLAGLGGLAIGTALAKLSGDTESPVGVTGEPPAAPDPSTSTSTSTSTTPAASEEPANDVRVRILSARLLPASSPAGKRRQRARVSVHVRVTNRGERRFVPTRPVLVAGGDRVETDADQDTADTNLEALAPGATGDVTLRFETAGAVTKRVRQQRRARLIIAGKTVTATVKIGGASGGAATPERGSSGTATQPPPPPPPPPVQPPAAP